MSRSKSRIHVQRSGSNWSQLSKSFTGRQAYVVGIGLIIIVALVGVMTHINVHREVEKQIGNQLRTTLAASVTGLHEWVDSQEIHLRMTCRTEGLQRLSQELLALEQDDPSLKSNAVIEAQERVVRMLTPMAREGHYTGFSLFSPQGRILADMERNRLGTSLHYSFVGQLQKVLDGEVLLGLPVVSPYTGKVTMYVAGPVYDEEENVIAAFAYTFDPATDFSRILQSVRSGASGETYAFDEDIRMISQSRFVGDLYEWGLITNKTSSILDIQIREPEGDMTEGYKLTIPHDALPMTRMARDLLANDNRPEWPRIGVDAKGYRDYRGVPVVGAWTWLPDYNFGVATEIDKHEAYAPLRQLRWTYLLVLTLLSVSLSVAFDSSLKQYRARRRLKKVMLQARRLGQYVMEHKIGEGGMGEVYKAKHLLMRRPTAVKILNPGNNDRESITRFEREVQLTSQLSHPNTIEVYDFGHTPDNLFYYVMEYLDGMNLREIILNMGALPPERIVYFVDQVCGSLHEAHQLGIIHRDIKPHNLFICRRGGLFDFVKVLDFGLVKELNAGNGFTLTQDNVLAGTPMYMSPEAIKTPSQVDGRSDVYSLGMVMYYMLTATFPFAEDTDPVSLCMKQLNEDPPVPSFVSVGKLPADLEEVIMRCLEKNPDLRYQSILDLRDAVLACECANKWSQGQAEAWWADWYSIHEETDIAEAQKQVAISQPSIMVDVLKRS